MDTLEQVRTQEPVPPSRLQPRLSRDLETICLKCLEKEPGKRYANAEALAKDLHRFEIGEPIQAKPVSVWRRGMKWARRRPSLAALVMVIIAAAVSLLIGGVYFSSRVDDALKEAKSRRREAERQVVHFNVLKGQDAVEKGDLLGSLPWFVEALKLEQGGSEQQEIHRTRLAAILRQCPRLVQIFCHQMPVLHAEFSRDGRYLVTACADSTAQVWNVESGESIAPPLRHDRPVLHAAFSSDCRFVVTASEDSTARVWEVETGKLLRTLKHEGFVGLAETEVLLIFD